jgi:hypothetical protein
LPLVNARFLISTVGDEPLIKGNPECRDLVDEAKNYLLLPNERQHMQGPRTRPRKPLRYGEVLYAGTFEYSKSNLQLKYSGWLV